MIYQPKALADRIFILLDEPEKTSSTLLMETPPRRNIGTVLSVGPFVSSVRVGDKVLFHLFDELPTYDPNVVVIRERSLLARMEPETLH